MPLYGFKKQFAQAVATGQKRRTIRPGRKRPTCPGETLFLYTGLRSTDARKLGEARCTRVARVEIHDNAVKIGGAWLSAKELETFARDDGFKSTGDFLEFFRKVHKLKHGAPLIGFELIEWGAIEPI